MLFWVYPSDLLFLCRFFRYMKEEMSHLKPYDNGERIQEEVGKL